MFHHQMVAASDLTLICCTIYACCMTDTKKVKTIEPYIRYCAYVMGHPSQTRHPRHACIQESYVQLSLHFALNLGYVPII